MVNESKQKFDDYVVKLAENHATWYAELVESVYMDAFIHGYKHGIEDGSGEDGD